MASVALAALAALGIYAAYRPIGGPSLTRVELAETLVEPCRAPVSRRRSVVVVGVKVREAEAAAVDAMEISGALGDRTVRRERQMCEVRGVGGAVREACLAEACDKGECTLRLPLEAAGYSSGDVRVRTHAPASGWGAWMSSGMPPSRSGLPVPAISVERDGETMRLSGPPSSSMRVSIVARGRVVADSPLPVDADGRATFKVPPGTERALVASSEASGGGVGQSTVHVAGPFDGTCPPERP